MITLINLGAQNASSIFVPNGSISFELNVDATVLASPYGFVCADIPIVFQLDANGNILPNAPAAAATIWSNAELNPQNAVGLGTYYLVTIYDANGARLNAVPMWWQFTQAANSTVNLSQMIPFATVGGNVIYYPTSFTIPTPTISTLGGVFSSAAVTSQWLTSINTDGTVSRSQPAFSDISGTIANDQLPDPLTVTTLIASGLITAQANIELGVIGSLSGQITLDGSTSGQATVTAPAVAGTNTNPISFSNSVNIPSGTVFTINTDTGLSRDSAGVIDIGNGTAGDISGTIKLAALTASGAIIGASISVTGATAAFGTIGTTSGVLTLHGSTSGSATITAPAVAGTTSNPIVVSNAISVVSVEGLTGQLTPNAAGGIAIGTTALPFASLWLGSTSAHNLQITGTFTGNRVWTVQDSTDTFVGRATTDTLTNKTISGQMTLAAATLGVGNAGSGNLTALGLGTGSGPASDAVVTWMEVTVNAGTFWIPLFQ